MGGSGGNDRTSGRIPVIVIGGPTASGKTSLAVSLALELGAEIISADSRQLFRSLRIGTARPSDEEMKGVPHHLSGIIELGQRYTVFDYVKDAQRLIGEIAARGRRTIICGGTGLYLRALIEGIFEIPDDDFLYRQEMIDLAAREGPAVLHKMLAQVDPGEAEKIHPNNLVKVIRALEIFRITGRTKSYWTENQTPPEQWFRFLQLILMPDRAQLYDRINNRVDQMIRQGLVEEARGVYNSPDREALRQRKIVGYEELIECFADRLPLESAIEAIKQNTRRFAKRQYTWFRGMRRAEFIEGFGGEVLNRCRGVCLAFLDVNI